MNKKLRESLAEVLRDWAEDAEHEDEVQDYSNALAEEMIHAAVSAYDKMIARIAAEPKGDET